jgi:hypothetical protein
MGIAMGMTHDVKDSRTGKSGAISETFRRMTFPRPRDSATENARCLMICKMRRHWGRAKQPRCRFWADFEGLPPSTAGMAGHPLQ